VNTRERIGRIVVGVIRQALTDAGVRGLVLLDDDSPEARLAGEWCREAAGAHFSWAQPGGSASVEVELTTRGGGASHPVETPEAVQQAVDRWGASIQAAHTPGGALLVGAANKTALLLSPAPPPEPLLPVGDLYATDLRALTGGYSLPARVRALAELAGGVDALDAALRAHFDERRRLEEALAPLPEEAREPLAQALSAARFARRRVGLVPKLGARTLGADLFA